jgi:hypothetical protein
MAKKKEIKPRTKINDLPKVEKELSKDEQKKVKGGIAGAQSSGDATTQMSNVFGYVPASVPAPPEAGEQKK